VLSSLDVVSLKFEVDKHHIRGVIPERITGHYAP